MNASKKIAIDEKSFASEIGSRIEQMRKLRGRTQTVVANLAGISQASLSETIAGKTSPSAYRIIKIADALQANVGWILTGDGPMDATDMFDAKLLALVLETTDKYFTDERLLPIPALKAAVFSFVWKWLQSHEGEIDRAEMYSYLRIVSRGFNSVEKGEVKDEPSNGEEGTNGSS